MLFSERHGYKKIDEKLLWEKMPDYLRKRIWNVFDAHIFMHIDSLCHLKRMTDTVVDFIRIFWERFLKGDMSNVRYENPSVLCDYMKEAFGKFEWHEVYDFIEFFASNFKDKDTMRLVLDGVNRVLEEDRAPYRIISGIVAPLTSEEEIKEIEKALSIPDKYAPARVHISKSLELFSKRPDPDYPNSIKESISAVESLAKIITGKEKSLSALIEQLPIHEAMKRGFKELYDWTSDEARHGRTGKPISCDESEARYMLITSSAFINYVISKYKESTT
ncbi:hypothetical protein IBX73_07665 [candidate division WOR-3 bacterium]|nr:hypothetical protein [candidate division WOR-3 bacterium]